MANPTPKRHHTIVLRPLPATRFTIFGSDVHLEFEKGKTREQIQWLLNWVVAHLEPIAQAEERAAAQAKEVSGEIAEPELPPPPPPEPSTSSGPITSFPFIKVANGAERGGFKAEDYEKNE